MSVTHLCRWPARSWRAFTTSSCLLNTRKKYTASVRENLRALLQHTAQPVSVLTVKSATGSEPYHGATLSSFSSISFHPFPIISFALQLPSRSADALQSRIAQSSSTLPQGATDNQPEAHLVINILSAHQSDTAIRFSRPDLYPKPFLDHPSARYTLTGEGIPKFVGSLGVLSCSLLASLPLNAASDTRRLARAMEAHALPSGVEVEPGSSSSMLYLARVLRIEATEEAREGSRMGPEDEWPLPLVYHRREYGTVKPLS